MLALWEVASVASSVLIAEWLLLSLARDQPAIFSIPVGLAFAVMLTSHWLRRETLNDIGIRLDNLMPALLTVALPTCISVALIVFVGWWFGGLRLAAGPATRAHYLFLPFWTFLQQYVVQGFMNRRLQLVFGKGWLSIL